MARTRNTEEIVRDGPEGVSITDMFAHRLNEQSHQSHGLLGRNHLLHFDSPFAFGLDQLAPPLDEAHHLGPCRPIGVAAFGQIDQRVRRGDETVWVARTTGSPELHCRLAQHAPDAARLPGIHPAHDIADAPVEHGEFFGERQFVRIAQRFLIIVQ